MFHVSVKKWLVTTLILLCAATQAQTSSEIVFGQLSPFTNLPTPEALEINQGANAYLAQINKSGVLPRKMSLFKMDDEYNGDKFVEQFGKAMAKSPLVMITPIGSTAVKRMLSDKLLDKSDVVVMNAIPGAESLRNPGHPRFFHVRAGDKQQIEKLVSNAKAIGISRLAVLNNDQEMGLSGVQVAQDEANRVGGLQLKGMTSASDAPSITAASVKIATLNPQGVLIVGPPRFSVDAVAALRKSGVSQPLFVLSYVQPGLLIKVAGLEGARGVGISQTYPNPNNSTLPLMREFHTAMKASFPDVSHYTPFQLEGYLCARTLVEALKRIKSREVTPALLAQSLKTMGELDFGGFRVDFTKSNIGSKFVDIAVVSSEGKLLY